MPSASEPSSHTSCSTHLASHSWFLPLSGSNTSHIVGIKEEERLEGGKEREHKERGGEEEGEKMGEEEEREHTGDKGKRIPQDLR